jgi:probable F420-dependent oxidoreductase
VAGTRRTAAGFGQAQRGGCGVAGAADRTVARVAKLELGRLGVALGPEDGPEFGAVLAELEQVGYDTIWLTGGPTMTSLSQIGAAVRATRRVPVATGIIPVVRFGADAVAAAYAELEASHPGRFVVGIGGAHGPEPLPTLHAYLDRLDTQPPTVPAERRVLAALGPRMLALARDRAAGALPVLVTPDYTARARELLGPDKALVVEQLIVPETDPGLARRYAREPLGQFAQIPPYQAHFRRMGFTDDDIGQLSDAFVDGLVSWGDDATIAARVGEHRQAGADQVAVNLITGSSELPLAHWRRLAAALA